MNQEMTFEQVRLARQLAATLNRAADDTAGADWDHQVDLMLARAAQQQQRRRRQWSAGLALAASVAFMVALPSGWLMKTNQELASVGSLSQIEAQLLEEMDWLLSMEDAARAAR